jgi:uncharacterized membrane protein
MPFRIPILSKIFRSTRELFLSFLTDSRYPAEAIEKAVKIAYGESGTLWKASTSTKIAITATTTDDSSTVIFCNYNGADRSEECGKSSMRL